MPLEYQYDLEAIEKIDTTDFTPRQLKMHEEFLNRARLERMYPARVRDEAFYKAKFEKNLRKHSGDGHWFIENVKPRKDGYNTFSMNGKQYIAHVAAMMLYEPDYYDPKRKLYHTCIQKHCVNPEHLSQKTQDDVSFEEYNAGVRVPGYNKGLAKRNEKLEVMRIFKTEEMMVEIIRKYYDKSKPLYYQNLIMIADEYDMDPSSIELLIKYRAQLSIPYPTYETEEEVL